MDDYLKNICDEFKLKLEYDKTAKVELIIFDDGRKYKLQYPSFMELHRVIMSSNNFDHALFEFGLENLYPENSKSPKINTDYLENTPSEALNLWSALLRRLLSNRFI